MTTSAAHTRALACGPERCTPGRVGGHDTHAVVWHSRQAELHARAVRHRPALKELIDEHPAQVAVLCSPPAPARLLRATGKGLVPLDRGGGDRYVTDLVAVLGIVSQ